MVRIPKERKQEIKKRYKNLKKTLPEDMHKYIIGKLVKEFGHCKQAIRCIVDPEYHEYFKTMHRARYYRNKPSYGMRAATKRKCDKCSYSMTKLRWGFRCPNCNQEVVTNPILYPNDKTPQELRKNYNNAVK